MNGKEGEEVPFHDFPVMERYRTEVDLRLEIRYGNDSSEMGRMISHHLGLDPVGGEESSKTSGKQIRPTALLLTVDALGGDWRKALPAATAIELYHNFTLLHDDIEDGDLTRHGRPTVGKLMGNARAINTGDRLYAAAIEELLKLGRNYPPEIARTAIEEFVYETPKVIEGQDKDIKFEAQDQVELMDYYEMVEGKTGRLLEISFAMGAILAGKDKFEVENISNVGLRMGTGFQMANDLHDLVSNDRGVIPSDIVKRKKTLPVIIAFKMLGSTDDGMRLRKLYSPATTSHYDYIALQAYNLIKKSGAIDYTKDYVTTRKQQVTDLIDKLQLPGWANRDLHTLNDIAFKV